MHIFSGALKGRKILSPKGKTVRPTSGRTREAIFNILTHGNFLDGNKTAIENSNVLDLYCGSGALAFEAISRGASHAVCIDIENINLEMVRQNAQKMGIEKQITCIRSDSSNPPPARMACQLVFIDPPYATGLAEKTLKNIASTNWLADKAIIVMELDKKEDVAIPEAFEALDERRYGITKLVILRYNA